MEEPKYCLKCKRKLPKKLVEKGRRLCNSCLKSNEEMGLVFHGTIRQVLENNWYEEFLLITNYLWIRT